MPWEVDPELIVDWLVALDQKSYELVIAALELLEERGPSLGRPVVDSVRGSRHANMKELRPGSSGRSELRVLFAFDPDRRAVLLVGGDKSGASGTAQVSRWRMSAWIDTLLCCAGRISDGPGCQETD
jgi:hypothetical protein